MLSIVAAIAIAAGDAASRGRPLDWTFGRRDLHALRWTGGQLQFFRGQHLALRYDRPAPESTAAMVVPTVDVIGWDAPDSSGFATPAFHQVWLTMNSWPPLTERATVVFGGQFAVPITTADGKQTIEYRDFGYAVAARAIATWPFAAMLAIVAARLGLRAWRASLRPGHCRACGYDLRASPDRCPECGTPATDPAVAR